MDRRPSEMNEKHTACSTAERLTFEEYVRTHVGAAKKALQDENLDKWDAAADELIVELNEEAPLPEIRSLYELLGFVYFLVHFEFWNPFLLHQGAMDLWDRYESGDKSRT